MVGWEEPEPEWATFRLLKLLVPKDGKETQLCHSVTDRL